MQGQRIGYVRVSTLDQNPERPLEQVQVDRLARNLDDLRRLVQHLITRGVRITFLKENLTFTGEDTPMAQLMLSVMGAFADSPRRSRRQSSW